MKKCTKCCEQKCLDEFYTRCDRKTVQHTSWCKLCVDKNVLDRQRQFKLDCLAYCGDSCADCGLKGHPAVFDFHHLDPSKKDFNVAASRTTRINDKIRAELDGCVTLCSNCHRLRHTMY